MRRNIISIIVLLSSSLILSAQDLTVEYNFGYGAFSMQDFKNFLRDKSYTNSEGIELKNLKVTDNFPGYWINQMKVGVELTKVHHVGVSLDFMNTAGRKAVSDFTGRYDYTLRVKGVRIGDFYRFFPDFLSNGNVRPYIMLTAGIVLNKCKTEENFEIYETSIDNTNKFSLNGFNFFVEPALGCKIKVHNNFALNLNAGYQLDFVTYIENKGNELDMSPVWSGLRFQGGVIYYIPLRK